MSYRIVGKKVDYLKNMNEKPLKVNAYSCYMFCHGFLIQSRVHKVERFHDVWFAILFTLAT